MDRSKREVSDGLARNGRRRSDNRHPGPSVFDSWFRRDHLVIHKAQTIICRMDDRELAAFHQYDFYYRRSALYRDHVSALHSFLTHSFASQLAPNNYSLVLALPRPFYRSLRGRSLGLLSSPQSSELALRCSRVESFNNK